MRVDYIVNKKKQGRGEIIFMPDFTELDALKLEALSRCMGEYLDSLGKTDLAKMSEEEWRGLVEVAYYNATVPF